MGPIVQLTVLVVIILTLYMIVRMAATASSFLTGKRYKAYRHLATRYRGKYESRGLAEPPTVSFSYNGSAVRVGLAPTIAGQVNNPRTRVVARFPRGLPFRLELAPIARPAPAQAPKGTRLVRVGNPEFDRGYVVQANDTEMANEFLSPTVRWAIDNLQRLGPPGGILISINPERLLVQVDRNLGQSVDALAAMVREALVILDGLQVGVSARLSQGVSIVEVGPADATDAGLPICKVCGETIAAPEVLCVSCRTPHHRDCWEFVGACSIYGCKGKHCVDA
ncbi:hypothetical protein [Singulisphaera sp. PoT]|uniref:hypothetical protein n=1 Tax=Singulisphaera sp. PoT TaxID=3411797 RepID=UPI003BF51DE0